MRVRDIIPPRLLNAFVQGMCLVIKAIQIELDARILTLVGAQYIDRSVGRTVVRNNNLKILIGLRQNAVEGTGDKPLVVIRWKNNADTWYIRLSSLLGRPDQRLNCRHVRGRSSASSVMTLDGRCSAMVFTVSVGGRSPPTPQRLTRRWAPAAHYLASLVLSIGL